MPPDDSETPGQSMKRIEAEVRGMSNAQRGLEGYSGNIGAQRGPLSAMVMSSGDPNSGAPQSYGVRGALGPVSFTHTQPSAPVAPNRTVGINVPFNADAYFGVNAAQTPGGRQYGVEAGTPLPAPRTAGGTPYEGAQGSINAYGQYNPTRRDLNAGFEMRRSFEHGGPVHMEEGGEPRPLTIFRKSPPPSAPVADVEQRGTERPIDYSAMMQAYADVQKGFQPTQNVMPEEVRTPRNLASMLQPPEDQGAVSPTFQGVQEGLESAGRGAVQVPSTIGQYIKDTSEKPDPSARLGEDIGAFGKQMLHGAAEDPAGFIGGALPIIGNILAGADLSKVKDLALKARADGDEETAKKLDQISSVAAASIVLPGAAGVVSKAALKEAERTAVKEAIKSTAEEAARVSEKFAGKAGTSVAGDVNKATGAVEDASKIVGAGPIRRGGQSIEEIVASMSKMDPEEVAAVRQANAGRGLDFPEEAGLDRLRMNLQREQKAAEKGTEMPGMPANERMVIRGPEGKPDFVTGKITPEDWVNRAESMMSPAEIKESANWYKTVRNEFLKYTNGDQEKADKYMRAWLVTQQNVDVGGAMNNVLLQREQFGRGVPAEQMKAAGMPNPTGAARSVLQDEPIAQGVGQKIADFVDAAEGKDVRSWMANHPEGGAPFVVDVHTARDTGLVDEKLLNHLRRRGYNEEDLQKAVVDMKGTPSGPQYENRAHWGRNTLTDHLNEIKWQGRSDWTPSEVQAVGWMGMTRLTADKAEDVVSGIERNVRRVSFEIAPGEGSPWEKMFGAEFSALPLQEQQRITQIVAEPAMEAASKISGIDLTNLVHGTGGWNMYQNPAAVGQALATKQGSEIAANAVGYLLQQTEVWSNSVKPMTKNPKAFAVDFMQESKGGNNYLASNEGIKDFWEQVQKMDPTAGSKKPLFVGYQPIVSADGRPGIRVLIDRGGIKTQGALEEAIKGPMSKMLEDFPTDISIRGHEAELTKARNDWKGQSDGQGYLARLEQLLGRNPAAELDPVRGQLEEIFKRELDSLKRPQRKAEGGKVNFAKGGAVEEKKGDLDDLLFDVAHRAARKNMNVRQLSMLIKLATGADANWSHNLAGHLVSGNVTAIRLHSERYPKIVKAISRLDAMLGGSKWHGVVDDHPLEGARVDHDMIKTAIDSGGTTDAVKHALRVLLEGSDHG